MALFCPPNHGNGPDRLAAAFGIVFLSSCYIRSIIHHGCDFIKIKRCCHGEPRVFDFPTYTLDVPQTIMAIWLMHVEAAINSTAEGPIQHTIQIGPWPLLSLQILTKVVK